MISKGELASPHRSFYVVVPLKYRVLGCLPPEQFIPQLMEKTGDLYHVGLLSAAQFHGAAHHKPQRFQVMVGNPRASINCGRIRVDFYVRKDLEHVATVSINTPRGTVRISSPEATAFELVGYARQAGGLDTIATVIMELAEVIDAHRLAEEAVKCPLAWSQKLGFLLERVGVCSSAEALFPHVEKHAGRVAPLDASLPRTGSQRSRRWLIAINTDVEADD